MYFFYCAIQAKASSLCGGSRDRTVLKANVLERHWAAIVQVDIRGRIHSMVVRRKYFVRAVVDAGHFYELVLKIRRVRLAEGS